MKAKSRGVSIVVITDKAISPLVLLIFFWVTGILTTISGIHYLYGGLRIMNASYGNGSRGDDSG